MIVDDHEVERSEIQRLPLKPSDTDAGNCKLSTVN
jgi:hypothetical protein